MINKNMTNEDKSNREEWIKARMRSCAQVKTLTPEQHRALAVLSLYRHNIHVGRNEFFKSSSGLKRKYSEFLTKTMPIMLRVANLPPLELKSQLDYMPDDETARTLGLTGEYWELCRNTCIAEAERINSIIESYLRGIDKVHKTWYAPSGFTRESCSKEGIIEKAG